jgi:hypothetical protein
VREFVLSYNQNGKGVQGWQPFEGEELLHSLGLETIFSTQSFALSGE